MEGTWKQLNAVATPLLADGIADAGAYRVDRLGGRVEID